MEPIKLSQRSKKEQIAYYEGFLAGMRWCNNEYEIIAPNVDVHDTLSQLYQQKIRDYYAKEQTDGPTD
jgi:hypothetical protein